MAPKVAAAKGKPAAAKGKPADPPKEEAEKSDTSSSEEEDGEDQEKEPEAANDEESEEEDETKGLETEPSLTSKAEEAQETQCQILLTGIGKRGKWDITTKSGLESLQSWLTASVKHRLNNDQHRSIWEAAISERHWSWTVPLADGRTVPSSRAR